MQIIVLAHNIRSTHNIGSVFRTSEGFGASELILSGYTPYPAIPEDTRLPHIAAKLSAQIHKTALGAETMIPYRHAKDVMNEVGSLKAAGYRIVALEQAPGSIKLREYAPPEKVCLVLGEEVHGIPLDLLDLCDDILEIEMAGRKESFNVSVAAGIALYALTSAPCGLPDDDAI